MLQLVGRLLRSANQETAAIIDSACDERMNECSDRVSSLSLTVRFAE